ncbi:MAG: type II toxin-antitoxin system RelE/ParE family toxin [Sorangiineae bacterium PRO1]|nr:type II toxin-antitoxin system RelE/ParE family toxin [Sorangiineae bacterium PRO1]
MPGFRLLRRARTDLVEIAHFTADRWGEPQAERYVTQLYEGFQRLVDFPELRRPSPDMPTYFRALEGKHAVFYRVSDGGEVLIVRVLHGAMLPELHLEEPSEGSDE